VCQPQAVPVRSASLGSLRCVRVSRTLPSARGANSNTTSDVPSQVKASRRGESKAVIVSSAWWPLASISRYLSGGGAWWGDSSECLKRSETLPPTCVSIGPLASHSPRFCESVR
jgi:hypothetical protein